MIRIQMKDLILERNQIWTSDLIDVHKLISKHFLSNISMFYRRPELLQESGPTVTQTSQALS